jgi:ISXO2-like transposase domain
VGRRLHHQAESYFSRLRRAVTGQHHHASKQCLCQYANEAAWREHHARTANGAQPGWRRAALADQPGMEGVLAATARWGRLTRYSWGRS